MEALTETDEFSAKDLKEINRCRIYPGSFTSPIYLPMTGSELLIRSGREGAMEGGSHPGHDRFNSGQHRGKHGNLHSNT
jgi:hypothetical protein